MKKHNSAYIVATLAESLETDALPLADRSDRWWDMFWYYVHIAEAQKIRERI